MQDVKLSDWLEQLAAKQPTPGGGGAAALFAATAAALVGMVSIYTTGPKWSKVSDRMQAIHDEADVLRRQALELITADAEAFAAVGTAYSLPKDSDEQKQQRAKAIQVALAGAAKPPQAAADCAIKVLELASELVQAGNPNVISDVAVAAAAARAALESANVNILINAKLISDSQIKAALEDSMTEAEKAILKAADIIAKTQQRITA